ncbi:MAG: class I SAM-dependent methyltransferase [Gammaproteobacteria bacterium]|nr:MAG: class I SAM-dependent methyltransferase [Gammaproteobacteria bacterium]
MNDSALLLLAERQRLCDGPQLLLADENLCSAPLQLLQRENLTIVSNRYDLYERAVAEGFLCQFSDFELDQFHSGSFSQVLFRVAKEKPLTHYLINQTRRLLADNGALALVGEKNDGIKTYAEKAGRYLGDRQRAEKHGNQYLAVLHKLEPVGEPLPDQDYPKLRPCIEIGDTRLLSKPGQFGWNKVDQGSALLAEHLAAFLGETNPRSILDLGCGYGYLSAMASRHCTATITATDNNAAALLSCKANFSSLGIDGSVIAGDCGNTIAEKFDSVICNPPFHQGFGTDSDLTDRFVASCRQHLRTSGRALFVVNRFVPLEQVSAKQAVHAELVAENRSFKVLSLALR